MIEGRNGRVYDPATKQRVQRVEHPETRSPAEVRAARAANQPSQPSGIPAAPVDPFQHTLQAETQRKGKFWRDSEAGRRFAADMTEKSEAWQAEQQAAKDRADFEQSVQPMVDHALRTLAQAQADEAVTVAELEQLKANVELARAGKADEYKAADKQWRDLQREKIESSAHAVDDQIRTLAGERDQLLAEAWQAEPEPVPEVKQPEPTVMVDRSLVAIERQVKTEHGYRTETVFEAAQ